MIRRARLVLTVAGVAVLAGCSGRSPSMLDPKGQEAKHVAGTWWLMFGIAMGVYAVVGSFIVIGILRGRGRDTGRPSRISDHAFVWIGGIAVPALILFVIGTVTVRTTAAIRRPSSHALLIDVQGHDWWWGVHYPHEDITTANEVHVPVGQPIQVSLRSDNVIHSFWVPQVGGKVDVIPGQTNVFRFKVEKAGTYRGECAEFCGLQHANMAFRMVAEPPGLFERWVTAHTAPPSEPTSQVAANGAVAFQRLPCAGCHTIRGTQARGTTGPNLSDLGSRTTLGAGIIENTPANLRRWMRDAPSIKPGVLMPPIPISSTDAAAVAAYLESLR